MAAQRENETRMARLKLEELGQVRLPTTGKSDKADFSDLGTTVRGLVGSFFRSMCDLPVSARARRLPWTLLRQGEGERERGAGEGGEREHEYSRYPEMAGCLLEKWCSTNELACLMNR